MPKKAVSAQERMDREFLAALRGGQARVGDRDIDTAKLLPYSYATFCRRKRYPGTFGIDDLRTFVRRFPPLPCVRASSAKGYARDIRAIEEAIRKIDAAPWEY